MAQYFKVLTAVVPTYETATPVGAVSVLFMVIFSGFVVALDDPCLATGSEAGFWDRVLESLFVNPYMASQQTKALRYERFHNRTLPPQSLLSTNRRKKWRRDLATTFATISGYCTWRDSRLLVVGILHKSIRICIHGHGAERVQEWLIWCNWSEWEGRGRGLPWNIRLQNRWSLDDNWAHIPCGILCANVGAELHPSTQLAVHQRSWRRGSSKWGCDRSSIPEGRKRRRQNKLSAGVPAVLSCLDPPELCCGLTNETWSKARTVQLL